MRRPRQLRRLDPQAGQWHHQQPQVWDNRLEAPREPLLPNQRMLVRKIALFVFLFCPVFDLKFIILCSVPLKLMYLPLRRIRFGYFFITNNGNLAHFNTCRIQNLSNPKPGHTTGASGRSARRGGGAGSGRTGCQQNCSPRKQASLVPSKASKTRLLSPHKHEQAKPYVNRWRNEMSG